MLTVALRRWGAWIVIADGLDWLVDGLIMQAFAPTYWSATRFIDYVAVDLHTGGFLLLAVGLAAIHERQGHAGLFERVGFLVAFVGAALAGVGNFAEDGLRVAAAGWAFMGGMLLLGTGLLLFGIASLRARMLPPACSVLLLLSLVVGYPLGGLWSNWGGTVLLALYRPELDGAAIQAGYTALYRSAFDLAQDLAEAEATGTRPEFIRKLTRVDLLGIEDLGMRRVPPTAAKDLLEIFTRRYETGPILVSSNRPVEDWGQVLGDTAAAGTLGDRFLHHAEIIRPQSRSRRLHDRQLRGRYHISRC